MKLDKFTQAYITAALWSSTDDGTPLDANYTVDDLAPATLERMKADCAAFQHAYWQDIVSDLELAGHDFWLTRCGHGCGFWEGDWPEDVGEHLTEACKVWGNVDLYVGDDGRIHA